MWRRIPFARLYINTIVFAGAVTVISLTLDSLTAYALARLDFRGRDVVFVAILVMLMLPFQVTLIPLFELLSDLGWTNTFRGLVVPRATNAFGIFFLRQFFLSLPRDLEEAARIDGAGEFRIYAADHAAPRGAGAVDAGAVPLHVQLERPAVAAHHQPDAATARRCRPGSPLFVGQHVVEYGLLMAASVLSLLPIVLFFLLIQRRFVAGHRHHGDQMNRLATVVIDPAYRVAPVPPRLFGSFVEHMGRCVYGGIYEPDHPSADPDGFRGDVGELVGELGVTLVRYPGGNFVSGYHWEDGDRPGRPTARRGSTWPGSRSRRTAVGHRRVRALGRTASGANR